MSDFARHLRIYTDNILSLLWDPACGNRWTQEQAEEIARKLLQSMYDLGHKEALAGIGVKPRHEESPDAEKGEGPSGTGCGQG